MEYPVIVADFSPFLGKKGFVCANRRLNFEYPSYNHREKALVLQRARKAYIWGIRLMTEGARNARSSLVALRYLRKLSGPIIVLAIGSAVLISLYTFAPEPNVEALPPAALSVFVETVQRADTQVSITARGEVRPRIAIDVVAQVGGRVESVAKNFIEGGKISAGGTLVTLEDDTYQLALADAQARLAARQLELAQALADADVARQQLIGEANASALALRKPQIVQARAAVMAAELATDKAKRDIERTRLQVPFDSRIASTQVDIGQYVGVGSSVARVFSVDVAEVRLSLSDRDLEGLGVPIGFFSERGQGLDAEFSARIGGEIRTWSGELRRLDAAINANTRTVFATAEVLMPFETGGSIMPMAPGLFVEARIKGRLLKDVAVIPVSALRAGNRVFLLRKDAKLEIRDVEVTHVGSERALVTAGISTGDKVIISAIRNPIQGMRLKAVSINGPNTIVSAEKPIL